MRVEIKKKEVMEEIYALSALQGYVSMPERERALLQEDQAEGLAVLVADAFAEIVMELMPRVADCGMPGDNDNGNMWIELKDGYGEDVMMPAVAAVIAKSMACTVLSAIYEECGGGEAYARRARRGIAIAREAIDSRGELPRLRGWR